MHAGLAGSRPEKAHTQLDWLSSSATQQMF
jgi:hypothetical protein